VELLNNVAASVDGFADSNFGPDQARQWLADKYPGSFEISTDSGGDSGSDVGGPTLRLKDGARMPSPEALKTDLGLGDTDSAPGGDSESSLLPLERRKLALQRQSMLASMVMLGMQRIVGESGRITASMPGVGDMLFSQSPLQKKCPIVVPRRAMLRGGGQREIWR
jgi:hypothetical protein